MEAEERERGEGIGNGRKVIVLIEKATNSTELEVDPRLLNAIKAVVRYSDSELRLSAEILMDLMKRDHSQVRYLALLIINELFMRSKLFRTLIVENLDQLMTLSVGFRRNLPLPAPPAVASVLRSKAIEFLEKWNVSFGFHYRQLRLGYDYLKNTLRLQFPNIQANRERIQQERRERERKSKEILLKKYEFLKENVSSIEGGIMSTVEEIDECLDILHSEHESMSDDILDDDDDDAAFRSLELQRIRLDALREGEKVYENSENKVIFDALRELYKLLVTKHLVCIQEWISVLLKVEVADNRFRDSSLKLFIDILNRLKSVKRKCEEAGCSLTNSSKPNEEEDFWEEGIVGSNVTSLSMTSNENKALEIALNTTGIENKAPAMVSSSHRMNMNNDNLGSNKKCSAGSNTDSMQHGKEETESNTLRSKLMAEAPVVHWGSNLDDWGSQRVYMANQRGLELQSHWGRVDNDRVLPADKIDELNVQAVPYEEEQVEIQPCGAPLRNGGLCQRRDIKVCPFHGPVIPRDDEGRPLDNLSPSKETNMNFKTDLVEELAKQAVKNVRERDKEVAEKRVVDKRSLKRAKLAKIREHNEVVLRDAALASTSRSAALGEDGEDRSSAKEKKKGLASMLQKKVTSKDRIAQKLLGLRARGCS
ncbi:UV-stimulated scaffold protein A homolog [Arachis stenosperma]|uniref:UV-stimulated scaffold protein A homolog n=1 Tax=Arachis stenosperma TaxID=217475 RepID=UPI0025AC0E4F|nr:UV-stimulated scaffold protein A homolog [Arachis stenosperma]